MGHVDALKQEKDLIISDYAALKEYADGLKQYTDDLMKENENLRSEAIAKHEENQDVKEKLHVIKKQDSTKLKHSLAKAKEKLLALTGKCALLSTSTHW